MKRGAGFKGIVATRSEYFSVNCGAPSPRQILHPQHAPHRRFIDNVSAAPVAQMWHVASALTRELALVARRPDQFRIYAELETSCDRTIRPTAVDASKRAMFKLSIM